MSDLAIALSLLVGGLFGMGFALIAAFSATLKEASENDAIDAAALEGDLTSFVRSLNQKDE